MVKCIDQLILTEFIDGLSKRYPGKKIVVETIGTIKHMGEKYRVLYINVPEEIPVYSLLRKDKCKEEDPLHTLNELIRNAKADLDKWLSFTKELAKRIKNISSWPAKSKCLSEKHCIIKYLEETKRIGGLLFLDYFDNYELLFVRVLPPYMPFTAKIPGLFIQAGYIPLMILITYPIYEAVIAMARLVLPGHPLDLDPNKLESIYMKIAAILLDKYNRELSIKSIELLQPDEALLKHIDYPLEELVMYITMDGIFFAKPGRDESVQHNLMAPPVSPEMLVDYMSLREAVQTIYPPDVDIDLSLS